MSSFSKMRVTPARAVLSRNTANAIRFCVKHYPSQFTDEDLTTAVFIEHIGDWYEICNNHRRGIAFSYYNREAHERYVNWCIGTRCVVKRVEVALVKFLMLPSLSIRNGLLLSLGRVRIISLASSGVAGVVGVTSPLGGAGAHAVDALPGVKVGGTFVRGRGV